MDLLKALRLKDAQHAIGIMTECEREGLTLAQCIAEGKKLVPSAAANIYTDNLLCPSCGKGIFIKLPVNNSPATAVGGEFTAMRLCRKCLYEEWII